MKIAIVGLSVSSSWGNGHATTYRSLIKGLQRRGHDVLFYERNETWYADNRDLPDCEWLHFYDSAASLLRAHRDDLASADAVIIGSYVRESSLLIEDLRRFARGLLAFYDIDTPVTIAQLREDCCEYLERKQLPKFDLYLSFSGGTVLDELRALGARRPVALYCSVDPDLHGPREVPNGIDLGYLGTWSEDRHPAVKQLLLEPAARWAEGRFAIAGPQYPDAAEWPGNVSHVAHLSPNEHAGFYCSQRFTLNVTRANMRRMGYSPSVRLFEAACCGTPVISDYWEGLDDFFRVGEEILVAATGDDVLGFVKEMSDGDRAALAKAARERVLTSHTGLTRAAELEKQLA
ncbi:MAG TPA: glycosyltransferase [Woeseiaceae bacterium]|nr:glycosyltransferase [Woeseiaceae bacterium]